MPTILLSTLDLQIEFPNQPYKTTCLIVRTQMMNPIKQEAQMTVPDKQSKVDDHSDHEHGDDEEESEEESEDEDSEDAQDFPINIMPEKLHAIDITDAIL